jgi:hypothetical protein
MKTDFVLCDDQLHFSSQCEANDAWVDNMARFSFPALKRNLPRRFYISSAQGHQER